MINCEEYFMIRDLKSKGMSITQIAKEVGVNRKTVSSWLKKNTLPSYKRKSVKGSKLEPFKAYILERMNEGCVNAVVLYDEIVEKGYQGKLTILREFMRPYREKALSKASIRYETPPGKQAQVDWGEFFAQQADGKFKKLYAFIMILGYSRDYYLEFTEDSKFDTLVGCHERAFSYFGGVPESILYDNMKTVVAHSHKAGMDKWNQRFLRFADHHNFTPIRHRPYKPRTKGKVERGVKYVRGNFWPRIKTFRDLSDLNEKALVWLDTKCNARLHQTTRRVPKEALLEERLMPMNLEPFLASDLVSRKVMNDCMISYESNYYSVPFRFVGSRIGIKDLRNGMIEIYDETGTLIDSHCKKSGKHQVQKIKKHFEGLLTQNQKAKARKAPLMIPDQSPKVHQRPLEVYDCIIPVRWFNDYAKTQASIRGAESNPYGCCV